MITCWLAKSCPTCREYRYVLYFTSARGEDIGLDILRRIIRAGYSIDIDFLVDLAFECHRPAAAKSCVGEAVIKRQDSNYFEQPVCTHCIWAFVHFGWLPAGNVCHFVSTVCNCNQRICREQQTQTDRRSRPFSIIYFSIIFFFKRNVYYTLRLKKNDITWKRAWGRNFTHFNMLLINNNKQTNNTNNKSINNDITKKQKFMLRSSL